MNSYSSINIQRIILGVSDRLPGAEKSTICSLDTKLWILEPETASPGPSVKHIIQSGTFVTHKGTFYGQFFNVIPSKFKGIVKYNHYIIGIYTEQPEPGTEIVRISVTTAVKDRSPEGKNFPIRRVRLQNRKFPLCISTSLKIPSPWGGYLLYHRKKRRFFF